MVQLSVVRASGKTDRTSIANTVTRKKELEEKTFDLQKSHWLFFYTISPLKKINDKDEWFISVPSSDCQLCRLL